MASLISAIVTLFVVRATSDQVRLAETKRQVQVSVLEDRFLAGDLRAALGAMGSFHGTT